MAHVSVMDMQRNLRTQIAQEDASEFESFAPGWKSHIRTAGSQHEVRTQLLHYWESMMRERFGFFSYTAPLIKGPRGQRLYWLIVLTRHQLAERLWKAILRATPEQGSLFV